MNRRAYLTVTAVALGGCAGIDATDSDDPNDAAGSTDSPDHDVDDPPANDMPAGDPDADDSADSRPAEVDHDVPPLSTWSVLSGSASADPDGDRVVLAASRSDSQVAIAHEFDSPADLSAGVPGLALRADEMVTPVIQLFDADGDRVDYRRTIKGGLPSMRYNFGVVRVDGDPDHSAVTEIRIVAWAGSDRTIEFECADFHFTPRPETGTVLIQFDDGYETDYTEAFPILEEYGYPATTFVNADRVPTASAGGYPTLDLDQLKAMRDAGWLVGNHTTSHPRLSDLDAAGQDAEIGGGARWLVDNGFEEGARYFAYPFGDYDATTLEVVADHHALGFGGGRPVQGYATNPVLCSRVSPPNAARAREILDRTAAFRGITSLFYHRLEGESLANFRAMVEALHEREAAGDLAVALPSDVERTLLY